MSRDDPGGHPRGGVGSGLATVNLKIDGRSGNSTTLNFVPTELAYPLVFIPCTRYSRVILPGAHKVFQVSTYKKELCAYTCRV